MNINKFLLALLFVLPVTSFAQESILFNKLQSAINDYSVKIENCNILQKANDLKVIDIKEIRNIVLQSPSVLSYLSEKAFNNCLQPERGVLAEAILYAYTKDTKNPTFILAESIKKTAFHPDFSDEMIFHELTTEQQNKFLSISNFNVPFDALALMDRIVSDD